MSELSERVKSQATETLSRFCEKRTRLHVQDKVRVGFSFHGDSVLLFKESPCLQDPAQDAYTPIAKFRFNHDKTWSLFYSDQSSKWHLHESVKPSRRLYIC